MLTSPANPLLKDVRRALARGGLTGEGYLVAETFHLLEEALRSDIDIKVVLAAESVHSAVRDYVRRLPGIRVAVVDDDVFRKLADTESSQGVITLAMPPTWKLEHTLRGQSLVVVLDGLQDPGNAGSIVRAAEAFGATGVLFTKGTVSPFNPKTLRASAGSLFRIPFVYGLDAEVARAALREKQIAVYAAMPHVGRTPRSAAGPLAGLSAPDTTSAALREGWPGGQPRTGESALPDLRQKGAFVIGSEAHGVSEPLRRGARALSIPTVGVESLNAAVAAGILLYEARRQRALAS